MEVGAKCQGKLGESGECQGNAWECVQSARRIQGNVWEWEWVQRARGVQGNARGKYEGKQGECGGMQVNTREMQGNARGMQGNARGTKGSVCTMAGKSGE